MVSSSRFNCSVCSLGALDLHAVYLSENLAILSARLAFAISTAFEVSAVEQAQMRNASKPVTYLLIIRITLIAKAARANRGPKLLFFII